MIPSTPSEPRPCRSRREAAASSARPRHPVPDPETGEEVALLGQPAVKLPLPPGTLPSLWEWDDARYEAAYLSRFEGFYDVGDSGLVDEDGFVHILARTDDVRAPSSLSCSLLPSFLRSLVRLCSTMTLKIPHTHDSKFNHKS